VTEDRDDVTGDAENLALYLPVPLVFYDSTWTIVQPGDSPDKVPDYEPDLERCGYCNGCGETLVSYLGDRDAQIDARCHMVASNIRSILRPDCSEWENAPLYYKCGPIAEGPLGGGSWPADPWPTG